MNPIGPITGFILAGGTSSRMGTDKALLPYRGRPMLLHMASVLRPLVTQLVVVSDNEMHRDLGLKVIPDLVPGLGPVGGIHTALSTTATEFNLIISCDMPLMQGHVLGRLVKAASGNLVTHGQTASHTHPLPGVYHRDAAATFAQAIMDNRQRLTEVTGKLGHCRCIPFDDDTAFCNMNTPQTYKELNNGHHSTLSGHVG